MIFVTDGPLGQRQELEDYENTAEAHPVSPPPLLSRPPPYPDIYS